MIKYSVVIVFSLLISFKIFSQTSLYSGKNPYSKNYETGDIIKVHINNFFSINFIGDWDEKYETKLKLEPDNKNIPFLKSAEQSRLNQRRQKERQTTSQKLSFELSGIVTRQADGKLILNAMRIIQVDGKAARINCAGIVNEKKINNGGINSDDIANLDLVIITKPELPLDKTLTGITPTEGAADAQDPSQYLTKEQKQQYIIHHLQEILGALK